MKKKELMKVENELSNDKLTQIIGGVSSSRISVTVSLASQSELSASCHPNCSIMCRYLAVAETRDILLPKLMSGELEINDLNS